MKDERVKGDDQKTEHQPRKKVKGQESVQSRLWEFMLNGRAGKPVDGFIPSTLFGCSEKE
jgi:hypothetical protein